MSGLSSTVESEIVQAPSESLSVRTSSSPVARDILIPNEVLSSDGVCVLSIVYVLRVCYK